MHIQVRVDYYGVMDETNTLVSMATCLYWKQRINSIDPITNDFLLSIPKSLSLSLLK